MCSKKNLKNNFFSFSFVSNLWNPFFSLNNFEPNDAMNGYEQSELQQQMLEMRDDPAMSSYHVPNTVGNSTPQNK